MKKIKLLMTLLSLMTVAISGGTAVSAAETQKTTEGTIKFEAGDVDEESVIVKPNEDDTAGAKEEIIKVPDGVSGKGNLRIQFVPNFRFGTKSGFLTDMQTQSAEVLALQNAGGVDTGKKIPPFVQVTNNSGIVGENAGWSLSAKATPFTGTHATLAAHVLTGAHIALPGSTLTMTRGTTAAANLIATKQNNSIIPIDGSSVVVLSTKGDTNGKQISNIFHDNYQEAATYASGTTTGVNFVKPAGEAARKDYNYKSTITWTLTDGL